MNSSDYFFQLLIQQSLSLKAIKDVNTWRERAVLLLDRFLELARQYCASFCVWKQVGLQILLKKWHLCGAPKYIFWIWHLHVKSSKTGVPSCEHVKIFNRSFVQTDDDSLIRYKMHWHLLCWSWRLRAPTLQRKNHFRRDGKNAWITPQTQFSHHISPIHLQCPNLITKLSSLFVALLCGPQHQNDTMEPTTRSIRCQFPFHRRTRRRGTTRSAFTAFPIIRFYRSNKTRTSQSSTR